MSHPPEWPGHNTNKSIANVSSSAAAAQREFERQAQLARASIILHEARAAVAATSGDAVVLPSFINQPNCEFGSSCINQNAAHARVCILYAFSFVHTRLIIIHMCRMAYKTNSNIRIHHHGMATRPLLRHSQYQPHHHCQHSPAQQQHQQQQVSIRYQWMAALIYVQMVNHVRASPMCITSM